MPSAQDGPEIAGKAYWNGDGFGTGIMQNPGVQEQLAGYMLVVNPIVCPKCFLRYPKGTKVCKVCGTELPDK